MLCRCSFAVFIDYGSASRHRSLSGNVFVAQSGATLVLRLLCSLRGTAPRNDCNHVDFQFHALLTHYRRCSYANTHNEVHSYYESPLNDARTHRASCDSAQQPAQTNSDTTARRRPPAPGQQMIDPDECCTAADSRRLDRALDLAWEHHVCGPQNKARLTHTNPECAGDGLYCASSEYWGTHAKMGHKTYRPEEPAIPFLHARSAPGVKPAWAAMATTARMAATQ
ncbi:hypothetical protein C8T65DRAFT_67036 [Cerioporus squamosus]|nr:hypothetical protein C8T65DRAFT_67036 [Cerioporus squamosus]